MASTRKARLAALAAGVMATLAAGCGGGDSGSSGNAAAAPQSNAQVTKPAERRKNACALFDRADIEQIAKLKLSMLHDIVETDLTTCELREEGTTQPVIMTVAVSWKGGKERVRIEQTAMSMAKRLLNEPDVDIEELTGSKTVKGLADQAYFSDVMPSWVLKDDVFIQFLMPTFAHDQTTKAFTVAAKQALARLPAQLPPD